VIGQQVVHPVDEILLEHVLLVLRAAVLAVGHELERVLTLEHGAAPCRVEVQPERRELADAALGSRLPPSSDVDGEPNGLPVGSGKDEVRVVLAAFRSAVLEDRGERRLDGEREQIVRGEERRNGSGWSRGGMRLLCEHGSDQRHKHYRNEHHAHAPIVREIV
jgi:hypothetical protein